MKIGKKKLILSKHLMTVRYNNSQSGILNRNNGVVLEATVGLLSFLEHFQQPITEADIGRKFALGDLENKLYSLLNKQFILFADHDEEIEYLDNTRLSINKARACTENFMVYHPKDVIYPISILSELLEEVYSYMLGRGFRPLSRKQIIFVCDNQKEFNALWGSESVPYHVNFFVSHGRIIAIRADLIYSLVIADERVFKAIVHEITHIFLCENYTNLPVWCIEGLCEYFSANSYHISLDELIRSKGLYRFSELTKMARHSILDVDSSEIEINIAYRQSKSFVEFLTGLFGEDRLMECIFSTGLLKDFESNFREFFPHSLEHYEVEWRKSLGQAR
jgi:hypothetical protein